MKFTVRKRQLGSQYFTIQNHIFFFFFNNGSVSLFLSCYTTDTSYFYTFLNYFVLCLRLHLHINNSLSNSESVNSLNIHLLVMCLLITTYEQQHFYFSYVIYAPLP